MELSDMIYDEITEYIQKIVSKELGIKRDTQINANAIIDKCTSMPFVDLGQMDDVRFMITEYDDDEIEEQFPNIAKTLQDPNKKGVVAEAMWNTFMEISWTYGLDDCDDCDVNLYHFLTDVEKSLKD